MRRFSWFVLVKCVDYPIRMRHFSSRAIALGANFANKEIGRFTKSATADERIKRIEEVAEQMEEERKKGILCRKKVSRFFRRSLINLDRSIRRCFGK